MVTYLPVFVNSSLKPSEIFDFKIDESTIG